MGDVEPVLITYNRATCVDHSLSEFQENGWQGRAFHVLDNASTDATKKVVETRQQEWPGLRYHRNRWNIGGNANILRSVEIAQSEYHWVIGDDDAWTFDGAQELERVLAEGKADIIRLGWLVSDASRGKYLNARDLAMTEQFFFSSTSMISATIIRRSLVTQYLSAAYQDISNSHPHLVPVLHAADSGEALVYTLSKDYMVHTPSSEPGYFFGDLERHAAWYRMGKHIVKNGVLRARFLQEISREATRRRRGRFEEHLWLTKVALNAKALGVPQGRYLLSMLGDAAGVRAPVLLAAIVYMLMPQWVARPLRRFYRRLAGLPPSELRYDRTRI